MKILHDDGLQPDSIMYMWGLNIGTKRLTTAVCVCVDKYWSFMFIFFVERERERQ